MLISILIISFFISCNSIENGWKGIQPLNTDKNSVNNILGTPKIDQNNFFEYETTEAFIRINYSSGSCIKDYYGRGSYIIARDHVIDYTVRFKKLIKVSDFEFDKDKYSRSEDDTANFAYYTYVDSGIVLHILIKDGTEYVSKIDFMPTKSQRETFKCKE
jgi:hypothetical protein